MNIRNLDHPTFKRLNRRIHVATCKVRYAVESIKMIINCCLLGLLPNTDIYVQLHVQLLSALPPSRTFWVRCLSCIAVSTCLLFKILFVHGWKFP